MRKAPPLEKSRVGELKMKYFFIRSQILKKTGHGIDGKAEAGDTATLASSNTFFLAVVREMRVSHANFRAIYTRRCLTRGQAHLRPVPPNGGSPNPPVRGCASPGRAASKKKNAKSKKLFASYLARYWEIRPKTHGGVAHLVPSFRKGQLSSK